MKHFSLALVLILGAWAWAAQGGEMTASLASETRSEANRERDVYRHPAATLAFFEVEPTHTVVEIWPGAGWYTEILAPYLKGSGTLYAAHFPADSGVPYFEKSRGQFEAKMAAVPRFYGEVRVTSFNPADGVLNVPSASADRVLTFRSVHNWLRSDSEQEAFDLFYRAMKPGAILGVVEHRAPPGTERQTMVQSGYMTEAYVIELAQNAGFELVAKSEINANPKDSADHPMGVWTLPPTLRLGEEKRQHYLDIGESDRMTLKFRKPDHD